MELEDTGAIVFDAWIGGGVRTRMLPSSKQ